MGLLQSMRTARAGALEAAEDGRLRDLRKGISFRLAATQNIARVLADSVPTDAGSITR